MLVTLGAHGVLMYVGSTLNWNAYMHTRCIYIHEMYIQYWGGRDKHKLRALF